MAPIYYIENMKTKFEKHLAGAIEAINIDKQQILDFLASKMETELEQAISAAKAAHADAINEESKPENQYDTRALEASYLARGQAQRVADLKEALFTFKKMQIVTFNQVKPISATALIEVESNEKKMVLFFMPTGGGHSIVINGLQIHVVTPKTPLGSALLEKVVGDVVLVELGKSTTEYEILSVS